MGLRNRGAPQKAVRAQRRSWTRPCRSWVSQHVAARMGPGLFFSFNGYSMYIYIDRYMYIGYYRYDTGYMNYEWTMILCIFFFVFVHILYTYDMVRNVRSWGHDQLLGVEGLGKWHARAWQPLDWWFGLRWCNVVHIPQEMGVKCWAFVGHFQEETEAETMPFKQKATHDWNVEWSDKAFIMKQKWTASCMAQSL